MHLEYGQGRHITEQFAVEFLTAKHARYSVKQFAAVEFIIAHNFIRAPYALQFWHLVLQNMHGTVPAGWQLLVLLV